MEVNPVQAGIVMVRQGFVTGVDVPLPARHHLTVSAVAPNFDHIMGDVEEAFPVRPRISP